MDSIIKTVKKMGNFKKFLEIAKITGHIDSLDDCSSFTVFAPSDEVFEKMKKSVFINEGNERDLLGILKKHIVKGRIGSEQLFAGKELQSMQGGKVRISGDGKMVNNGIRLVRKDIKCRNGIVHMVDGLIEE